VTTNERVDQDWCEFLAVGRIVLVVLLPIPIHPSPPRADLEHDHHSRRAYTLAKQSSRSKPKERRNNGP
jgi:hypothetical protein